MNFPIIGASIGKKRGTRSIGFGGTLPLQSIEMLRKDELGSILQVSRFEGPVDHIVYDHQAFVEGFDFLLDGRC